MSGIAIGIPIMFLMVCLVLVIPVLVGVYVYRDAVRRNMNAVLWTLITILAPGFIGLIIYLIIRAEHDSLRCGTCDNPIKHSFAVCPYCGSPLKEHCPNCGYTLDAGWITCPDCGEDIPIELRSSSNKPKNDKGLKGILLAVLLIPLSLCLLMFLAMCGMIFSTSSGFSSTAIGMNSSEDVTTDFIDEWIEDCDAAGPGVYVLKAQDDSYLTSSEVATAHLVYCNNGYYVLDAHASMGGWFTDASVEFICLPVTSDKDSLLYFFEYIGDEPCFAKVICDGKKTDFETTNADYAAFSGLSSFITNDYIVIASIDENLPEIYSVECSFYSGDELISSEMAMSADNGTVAGADFSFFCPLDECDSTTRAEVTIRDINEEILSVADLYFYDNVRCNIDYMKDENGQMTIETY